MKKQISQKILEELVGKIINTDIRPGEKLSENKIGEEYGVSRTVVRNVFLRLQEAGFVEVVPHSGTFVTKIDFDYIRATLLLRLALEKDMLLKAVSDNKIKKNIIDKLEEIFEKQKKFTNNSNYIKEIAPLDNEFHRAIMNCYGEAVISKNFKMNEMINDHLMHLRRWRNITVVQGIPNEVILKEHAELIQKIKEDDKKAISDILDHHINRTTYSAPAWEDALASYFK